MIYELGQTDPIQGETVTQLQSSPPAEFFHPLPPLVGKSPNSDISPRDVGRFAIFFIENNLLKNIYLTKFRWGITIFGSPFLCSTASFSSSSHFCPTISSSSKAERMTFFLFQGGEGEWKRDRKNRQEVLN